mmetsp:Transcript_27413/g.77378  ORF Transcript_27413/g.77378 Transcript_27413/m.77378 type:complete len:326 (+) Transcript_27413:1807-2784(+)
MLSADRFHVLSGNTQEPTASGLRRKQVNIAGLTVTSTCLTKDTQGRPIDSSYKVAAYRLQISWKEGQLWWGSRKGAEIRVRPNACMCIATTHGCCFAMETHLVCHALRRPHWTANHSTHVRVPTQPDIVLVNGASPPTADCALCLLVCYDTMLQVMHIAAMDQMPLQLTRHQVGILYNVVAGTEGMDSVSLGFQGRGHRVFVHCHAGVGRTGDMAIALSEILCDSTPSNPKEKLLWLRQFRKGLVQTAEQLIDGLQLATTLLDEVYARAKYMPLQLLAEQKSRQREWMQDHHDELQEKSPKPKKKTLPVLLKNGGSSTGPIRGYP